MTSLTAEQKLKVAQEVMPQGVPFEWSIRECEYTHRIYVACDGVEVNEEIEWGPKNNDSQFKALVVWCAEKGYTVTVEADEFGTEIFELTNRAGNLCIQRDTYEDAVQAAVLAFKENEDG